MKKNFIYTVLFFLCGAVMFTSCEDMLDVESNRVEYEFDGWTFNDSVYSVLGILKKVQAVGDRQVLLGELRGDLLSIVDKNATDDIRNIAEFNFDADNNEYLAAKDYYAIINNCNVFLARVDTTLTYDNVRLMLREYVAVKSLRAWTYLQLIKNHSSIPYFTEPVLTHSAADEVMQTSYDRLSVIDKLIEDISLYENPKAYQMPLWTVSGFVESVSLTQKLFTPIRVLLGELYLWRASLNSPSHGNPGSDYAKAADCFYNYLAEDNEYTDYNNYVLLSEKPDEGNGGPTVAYYMSLFQQSSSPAVTNMVSYIPYNSNENNGIVSKLDDIFFPVDEVGENMVESSAAIAEISARYTYYADKDDYNKNPYEITSKKYPGDLRLYSTSASQRDNNDLNKTVYSNIILKHNYGGGSSMNDGVLYASASTKTLRVLLDRPENIYLHFAEALLGLEREGWTGAKELAMRVLKNGIKGRVSIYLNPDTLKDRPVLDSYGNYESESVPVYDPKNGGTQATILVNNTDEEGNLLYDEEGNLLQSTVYLTGIAVVDSINYENIITYDFSSETFASNKGIHSRGSGSGTWGNPYYALEDSVVAQYYGLDANGTYMRDTVALRGGYNKLVVKYQKDENGDYIMDETGNYVYEYNEDGTAVLYESQRDALEYNNYPDLTDEHRILYMYDKLIDEAALEMSWEGHRFYDLIRMASSLDDVDFLAERVAARNGEKDNALYGKLLNVNNWFLPLPNGYMSEVVDDINSDIANGDDDDVAGDASDDTPDSSVEDEETDNGGEDESDVAAGDDAE